MGGGLLPDFLSKVGVPKPGDIVPMPEGETQPVNGNQFVRPGKGSATKSDFISHEVLGAINLGLGVCCLLA